MPTSFSYRFAAALLMAAIGASRGAAAPASAWVEDHIPTSSVQGPRDVRVYLPPSYADSTRRYPTLYFLHGGPGSNQDWITSGDVGMILDRLERQHRIPECIAVLPDARGPARLGRSLYVNSWDGRSRMEDFITRDLVAWVDRHFRTVALARARDLIGISDGGGAALNLAFHHPDVFGGCAGLSGEYRLPVGRGSEPVLGTGEAADRIVTANSPLAYVARRADALRRLRIYFDCGWLDPAWFENRRLHRRLARLGIPHEYRSYAGSHSWTWWRAREPIAIVYLLHGASASPSRTIDPFSMNPGRAPRTTAGFAGRREAG